MVPKEKKKCLQTTLQGAQRTGETDLSLNQQVTLASDVQCKARDVDGALVGNLADHAVDQDVRASPTHTSTGAARKRRGEV